MNKKYIDIDGGKWGILLFFDFDMLDWDELAPVMEAFGMSERNIQKSIHILSTYNSGMAVSRGDLKMTAVFIGQPTSRGQFWNSIAHELYHASNAIIDYYGEDWDGEPAAYLQGYLMQRVVEEIAEPCMILPLIS